MGLRQELQKRIERKRQEVASLQSQIQSATSYIQALEDTLKLLPREGVNDGTSDALRPDSAVYKAREAIRAAGHPLHINEILGAIHKPNDRNNRAAIAGSISAYVRKGEIFTRPAPNTFGLVETNGQTNDLPASFGMDRPECEEG